MNSYSTNRKTYLFTSESVSEGHPDKMADQISDAILDAFLTSDPNARVACETVLADQFVLVAGEFKTKDNAVFEAVRDNAERIVRQMIRDIGYTSKEDGIDPDKCEIRIAFNRQSVHISQGVDQSGGEIGAGDQGLMFGYACDETPELIPLAICLAHKLVRKQAELRKSGALPWLRPDAKSQVSIRYVDGKPVAVEKVVLSTQHSPDISADSLRDLVRKEIVEAVIPAELRGNNFKVLINPTGQFEIGGPNGDTGLTGRKIIVDTYGGSCPHGGGAFSGKDPSKVDRSAAYMARYIAKNIVAAGLATRCLVQLAYAIGVVEPVSVMVDTYGTGTQSDEVLEVLVRENFRLTPASIINSLELKRPIYAQTAAYGHFGRTDVDLPWEKTDRAEHLNLLVTAWLQARANAARLIDDGVQFVEAVNSTLKHIGQLFEENTPYFYLVEAVHAVYQEKGILPADYQRKHYCMTHDSVNNTHTYTYNYPRIFVAGPPISTSAHIEPNRTKNQLIEQAVGITMRIGRRAHVSWSPTEAIYVEPVSWREQQGLDKKYPHIAINGPIACVLYYSKTLSKEELIKNGEEIVATWGSKDGYRVCVAWSPTEILWPSHDGKDGMNEIFYQILAELLGKPEIHSVAYRYGEDLRAFHMICAEQKRRAVIADSSLRQEFEINVLSDTLPDAKEWGCEVTYYEEGLGHGDLFIDLTDGEGCTVKELFEKYKRPAMYILTIQDFGEIKHYDKENRGEVFLYTRKVVAGAGTNRSSDRHEEHPRIIKLIGEVNNLPVEDSYRQELLRSIETYRKQILERPECPLEGGWNDLEALQQVTLSDRMEQWFGSFGEFGEKHDADT